MNIRSYYVEIKNRLLLLGLAWVSVVLVSYIFKEVLLFLITKQNSDFVSYTEEIFYFIFTEVTEIFYAYIMLIFFFGTQTFFLYFFYHILIFISLGLYKYEYKYLIFIFKTGILIYIFSVIIFNKILFPFSWNFFLSFQNFDILKSLTLYFEAKISEYLNFYITFYYICVLYFQIFVLLILMFDYFKNSLEIIKRFRKFLYYFFVIFSTFITPPDVSSQLILSISIIFSYEILVYYSILKKRSKNFNLVAS
jgi:sec-independent protein translocase protein TatC